MHLESAESQNNFITDPKSEMKLKKKSSGSWFSLASLAFKLLKKWQSFALSFPPSAEVFNQIVLFLFFPENESWSLKCPSVFIGHTNMYEITFYMSQSKVGETKTCYVGSKMRWALGEINNLNRGKFA